MTSFAARIVRRPKATADVHVRLLGLLQRTRHGIKLWIGATARAHDRRRASEAVVADTMRDTGMDPETASGIQAYQADLPFFMQSGVGKR